MKHPQIFRPRWPFVLWLLLWLIIAIVVCSCYSERKARDQFSKASLAYPEILAKTCSDKYPVRDSLIQGEPIVIFDTLMVDDASMERDTVVINDTVIITNTHQLPGTVITRTIVRTDTLYQTNHAALDLCEIERRAAVLSQQQLTKERDGWHSKAKKRFYIMWGLALLITIYIVWRIYRAFYLKK